MTDNDKKVLLALMPHNQLGVTDIHNETGMPNASIHASFKKLEGAGILEKIGKKRQLTNEGRQITLSL